MPSPNVPKGGGLNKKLGGVKTKWWLVGGLATGGIAFLYYKNAAASTTGNDPTAAVAPDPQDTGYDPYAGYDSSYGTAAGGAYGGGSSPVTDPNFPTADTTNTDLEAIYAQAAVDEATALGDIGTALTSMSHSPAAETNTQWMHNAIHSLEANGYTAAEARAAVHAYLAGAPLTTKQTHTIESAVGHVGPPPTPVGPIQHENVPKQSRKDDRSKSKHGKKQDDNPAKKTPAPHKTATNAAAAKHATLARPLARVRAAVRPTPVPTKRR